MFFVKKKKFVAKTALLEEWFDETLQELKKNYSLEIKTFIPISELKAIEEKANSCLSSINSLSYRYDYKSVSELEKSLKQVIKKSRDELYIQKNYFQIQFDPRVKTYKVLLKDGEKKMEIAYGRDIPINPFINEKKNIVESAVHEINQGNLKEPEEIKKFIIDRTNLRVTPYFLKLDSLKNNIVWNSDKEEPWMHALKIALDELNQDLMTLSEDIKAKSAELRKKWKDEYENQKKEKEETKDHFRKLFTEN